MNIPPAHFHAWMNPKLEVRQAFSYGKGIFTTASIATRERLIVWGGMIIPVSDITDDLGLQIAEDLVLMTAPASSSDEPANYVNHSCNPNAGLQGQIVLVAMRPIRADEEITFDYAMCLHASPGAPRYAMECQCGQTNCRKVITEDDWQQPDLQRRYDGYFQWYLQEKIDKLKRTRRRKKSI